MLGGLGERSWAAIRQSAGGTVVNKKARTRKAGSSRRAAGSAALSKSLKLVGVGAFAATAKFADWLIS
jgi:hypothetical protein